MSSTGWLPFPNMAVWWAFCLSFLLLRFQPTSGPLPARRMVPGGRPGIRCCQTGSCFLCSLWHLWKEVTRPGVSEGKWGVRRTEIKPSLCQTGRRSSINAQCMEIEMSGRILRVYFLDCQRFQVKLCHWFLDTRSKTQNKGERMTIS